MGEGLPPGSLVPRDAELPEQCQALLADLGEQVVRGVLLRKQVRRTLLQPCRLRQRRERCFHAIPRLLFWTAYDVATARGRPEASRDSSREISSPSSDTS